MYTINPIMHLLCGVRAAERVVVPLYDIKKAFETGLDGNVQLT